MPLYRPLTKPRPRSSGRESMANAQREMNPRRGGDATPGLFLRPLPGLGSDPRHATGPERRSDVGPVEATSAYGGEIS
jgi:hypothetical protein